MSQLNLFHRRKLARLILPAVALTLALAPGAATAQEPNVTIETDDIEVNLKNGAVTCALPSGVISSTYTSTPIGTAASPLADLNGTWSTYEPRLQCASSAGGAVGGGVIDLSGDFTGRAATAFGCPVDSVQQALNVSSGGLYLGGENVTISTMSWVLAGRQFVITGHGVDQQGRYVTITGSATHVATSPHGCGYMDQTYGYLVLNVTW